jgi:hypothetical protein
MSLRVFRTVAELKSFTAAADRLGISLPMASTASWHSPSQPDTMASDTYGDWRGLF